MSKYKKLEFLRTLLVILMQTNMKKTLKKKVVLLYIIKKSIILHRESLIHPQKKTQKKIKPFLLIS